MDDAASVTGATLKATTIAVGYSAPSILANLGGLTGNIGGGGGGGGGGGQVPPLTKDAATHFLRT